MGRQHLVAVSVLISQFPLLSNMAQQLQLASTSRSIRASGPSLSRSVSSPSVSLKTSWIPSQKRTTNLLLDENNYKYRIYRDNAASDMTWYRCVKRFDKDVKCPTTATLRKEDLIIVSLTAPHNHGTDILTDHVRCISTISWNKHAEIIAGTSTPRLSQVDS